MAKSSSSSKSLCLLSGAARASKPDPAAGPRTVNNAVRRRVHGYGPQERARRQRGGALFLLTDSILCWLCRLPHKVGSLVLGSYPPRPALIFHRRAAARVHAPSPGQGLDDGSLLPPQDDTGEARRKMHFAGLQSLTDAWIFFSFFSPPRRPAPGEAGS